MKLLQDTEDSWAHFVICILLNRTRAANVEAVLPALFSICPDPEVMAGAGDEIEHVIRPCGLYHIKARNLRRMSAAYWLWLASMAPPEDLPGVGRYASDSYRILFLHERPMVTDDKLRIYLWELDHAEEEHTD